MQFQLTYETAMIFGQAPVLKNSPMLHRSRFRRGLLLAALSVCACAAHAGNISFNLALTGTRLALINTGDSVAFFPGALTMQADGRWQPLSPPTGQQGLTQLPPGERMELVWPDARPLENLSALEHLRPTMVRFFDQAGVGFGQISFFTTPPAAAASVIADYAHGVLRLLPPRGEAIRATWVLWPREEGISGIRGALKGDDIVQPPAQRIVWRPDAKAARVFTGAALPPVVLIHETAQGYRLQKVAAGWPGGKQQRSPWLEASRVFYALALAFAAMAVGAMLWPWWRRRRGAASA